jgi:hypothetical protein
MSLIGADGTNSLAPGQTLALTAMEITLKDLVKTRVLGHLEVGARESVLARDVTRFCNQISA